MDFLSLEMVKSIERRQQKDVDKDSHVERSIDPSNEGSWRWFSHFSHVPYAAPLIIFPNWHLCFSCKFGSYTYEAIHPLASTNMHL